MVSGTDKIPSFFKNWDKMAIFLCPLPSYDSPQRYRSVIVAEDWQFYQRSGDALAGFSGIIEDASGRKRNGPIVLVVDYGRGLDGKLRKILVEVNWRGREKEGVGEMAWLKKKQMRLRKCILNRESNLVSFCRYIVNIGLLENC